MKHKILAIGLISISFLLPAAACGGSGPKLTEVTGFQYENGILSFGSVAGADGYEVEFEHRGETVYSDVVTETALDIEGLGLEGNLTVTVRPRAAKKTGPESSYSFVVLSTFGEIEFEAENYLYNFGTGKGNSNFRNNPLAHKGGYVGGIDDAGQGVYIDYLCPVEGTFDFVAHYLTDNAPSANDVWVNGEKAATFAFTERTGWGGEGQFDSAEAQVTISLKKGWNTISVIKNGNAQNNYGSYTELDYFVLKGTGETYNADDLAVYGEHPARYRLEAEMGSPRKKNAASNLYECKNPAIVEYEGKVFSNGFILGGIEQNYDGVEWHFYSPVRARYRITLAYACEAFEGSKPASPSICVTQEALGLFQSIDFVDHFAGVFRDLPYTRWGDVAVADGYVDITLEAGDNYIYCVLFTNAQVAGEDDPIESGFFQIDYIDLQYLEAL